MSVSNRIKKASVTNAVAGDSVLGDEKIATADIMEVGDPAALPRPKRKQLRDKQDRGLPPDDDLRMLARSYLKWQSELWPDLAKRGLLPQPSDAVIDEMVEDYKSRHRTGVVGLACVAPDVWGKIALGGFYGRFSCDNSSTLSMIDQLCNGLQKAASEKQFVPWSYIFADYSVTGLDASRQGYSMYKALLQNEEHRINTTYIDDFTRASREEIEWWRLANLSRRLRKRMVGASDSFNLDAPDWETQVAIYSVLSRLFIKSIREKSGRGMQGAARRGTCLGKLPLGFARRPVLDDDGRAVLNTDGSPKFQPCVDAATAKWVRKMFELYYKDKWSARKIARYFNSQKVDGWDGWNEATIRKMLRSPAYIGVFIWNRTRREFDYEQEKWTIVKNPRKDWIVHYAPKLALVPMEWWTGSRKQLAHARRTSPLTGRRQSRNEKSATTLFSGTLFCGYCERSELLLVHSDAKYKSIACPNGVHRGHGCQLTTSKSTRIIENSLLKHILDKLTDDDLLRQLVGQANDYIRAEARRPRVDVAPLRRQVKLLESQIKKYFKLIEATDDVATIDRYDGRVKDLGKQVAPFLDQIRAAERQNAPAPRLLDLKGLKQLLTNPRDVLNQSISAAAVALRNLTGPIRITQEQIPGRRHGARWIATFSLKFVEFLAKIAGEKDSPDRVTLEYLKSRFWTMPVECRAEIEDPQPFELHAPEVTRLADGGASINVISAKLGISAGTARNSLRFGRTGVRPTWKKKKKGGQCGTANKCKYLVIKDAVVKRHDVDGVPLEHLTGEFGVGIATIRRAYYAGRPDLVAKAAAGGSLYRVGARPKSETEARQRVAALLNSGLTRHEIAAQVGCGLSTVYRVRAQLKREKSA